MPDRVSHLLRFSDRSVRDVSPEYIEKKVLVKIGLEDFKGRLEKFLDIADAAGVIAVRKPKQLLEITISWNKTAQPEIPRLGLPTLCSGTRTYRTQDL